MGFGDFIDLGASAITYKNTYYILPRSKDNLRTHFHELVHVTQWMHLGSAPFIERYMQEIVNVGYNSSPLEQMAYSLDAYFSEGRERMDISNYVAQEI